MKECPAMPGTRRCPVAFCDCFIDTYPESPLELHPEAFTIGPNESLPNDPNDDQRVTPE